NLLANAAYTRGPETALTGAQATGAGIQNQLSLYGLQMMQNAMQNPMPSGAAVPGATGADTGAPATPAAVGAKLAAMTPNDWADNSAAAIQAKYQPVVATYTPQEQQWLQAAQGNPYNPIGQAQAKAFIASRQQA